MADRHYAFVDRKCSRCDGVGEIGAFAGLKICPNCNGKGLVGSYEEVPDIEYNGPSAFAHRLRLARESKKITMSKLAAQLGISEVELSDIERGRIEPIGELKKQLAEWIYDERH